MSAAAGRARLVRRATLGLIGVVALVGVTAAGCSSSPDAGPGATTSSAGSGSTAPGSTTAASTARPTTTAAGASTTTVAGPTSSSSRPATSATSTTSAVSTTSAAPVTSVAPASSVAPGQTPGLTPALTTQLFWVRPPDEDRLIDLPGFRDDPAAATKPLVVYGSVTNDGGVELARPFVVATWVDGGAPVASARAAVYLPGTTTPAATLAPGAMADVIVVITDPDQAARLAPLAATLAGGAG